MQRTVFQESPIDGFRSQKTETIAFSAIGSGKSFYSGSPDGVLSLYQLNTDANQNRVSCVLVDNLRKSHGRDKKQISSITIIENWKVFVCIVDSTVVVFDLTTGDIITTLSDTKGCSAVSISEKGLSMVVVSKKKLQIFTWQGSSFTFKREVALASDTPRTVTFLPNKLLLGYKKSFDVLDLGTYASVKILEADREGRGASLELASTPFRGPSVLLSTSNVGLVVSLSYLQSVGVSEPLLHAGSSHAERLEWSSPPHCVLRSTPFLLSLLSDSVEIHDEVSLVQLQRVQLFHPSVLTSSPTPPPMSLCVASVADNSIYDCAIVCTGDDAHFLKLVPLATQISYLVDKGLYEEALRIHLLSRQPSILREIDVGKVHEKFALSLFLRGEFEESVLQFISAGSSPMDVMQLFPEFVPVPLRQPVSGRIQALLTQIRSLSVDNTTKSAVKTSTNSQSRAASALAKFCSHHRRHTIVSAEKAETVKASGIGATVYDDELYSDPVEALKAAEVLDSVLLAALVRCTPPRRSDVLELLSVKNRCHIESSAALLASQGNSFIEALLWLYRSHDEHKRVLAALTEAHCVVPDGWTRPQFYTWTSSYLRELWFQDNAQLAPMALQALRPVFEYDAELGLSVLTSAHKLPSTNTRAPMQHQQQSFGGKGLTMTEVVQFLESIQPSPNSTTVKPSTTGQSVPTRSNNTSTSTQQLCPLSVAGVVFPLTSGALIAAAYLEWLVTQQSVPALIHDEYLGLLAQGLVAVRESTGDTVNEREVLANLNDLLPSDGDTLRLFKIYRRKLQHFLQVSTEFHPERALRLLPPSFRHEYALVLSRLGRHEEVLRIYVRQLQDLTLAEEYCGRIFQLSLQESVTAMSPESPDPVTGSTASLTGVARVPFLRVQGDYQNPYICLFKILLSKPIDDTNTNTNTSNDGLQVDTSSTTIQSVGSATNKDMVLCIHLAEVYFDRFDYNIFLDLLPYDLPFHFVSRYLSILFEFIDNKKKTLQIIHSLLRVREVGIRTSGDALAGKDSRL